MANLNNKVVSYYSILLLVISLWWVAPTEGQVRPLSFISRIAYEGTCTEPPGALASNLDLNWITSVRDLHTKYGNLQFWIQNAQLFLATDQVPFAALSEMGLRQEWDLNATWTGYGRKISQDCGVEISKKDKMPMVTCKVIRSDAGTDPGAWDGYSKRISITDNKTYALFIRCAGGLRSYWLTTTTGPEVKPEVLRKVAWQIVKLGFNLDRLYKNP